MLTTRVFEAPDIPASVRGEWDRLAVEAGRPFASPAWVLAWWSHLHPEDARLRVILARDGDRLAGVLPLVADGGHYAIAGSRVSPVELLSQAGLEADVAKAIALALAGLTPRPVTIQLQLNRNAPDWAELLSEAWPGRRGAWRWTCGESTVPFVDLGECDFDSWMNAKSASFRREMRRKRRKLDADEGSFRLATEDTLERDVYEFMRLHRSRLSSRGGSDLVGEGVEKMLIAAGSELLPSGRFRLVCLEMAGRTIAAQLLLEAGEESSAWNSGFDGEYADYSPSMQCLVYALADAFKRGTRTMSLGSGGQDYKYRLASGDETLSQLMLAPRGATYPLTRLRLAPRQMRRAVGKRISPEAKRRLFRLGRS